MNNIDNARAAREARESALERAASGHTTAELAERAIRLHVLAEEYERSQHERAEHERTQHEREQADEHDAPDRAGEEQ